MLASFPLPGLIPTTLSTTLLPLIIPVVAMRNLRPIDQKTISTVNSDIVGPTDLCSVSQPIGWLQSLCMCNLPGKKPPWFLFVLAKKLRYSNEFTAPGRFPDTYFGQSNQGSPRPSGPSPSARNPRFLQAYLPIRLQTLSIPR